MKLVACGFGVLGIAFAALLVPTVTAAYEQPEINSQTEELADPFRPANKAVFRLNEELLDPFVFEPVVRIHNKTVPRPARISIQHFLYNLGEPVTVENALLQGNFPQAAKSTGRFAVNTTVGLLGLMDIATILGLEPHKEDFGQTLGKYGVGQGAYIVLPVLGPSSARDVAGRVVDTLIDPLSLISFQGDIYVSAATKLLEELEERASDVKDDMSERAYANLSLQEQYVAERRSFQFEQIAEVNNAEAPVLAASASFARKVSQNGSPGTPLGSGDYQLLQQRLQKLSLFAQNIDMASSALTVTLDTLATEASLDCRSIWSELGDSWQPDIKRITIMTKPTGGPVFSCTKFIS